MVQDVRTSEARRGEPGASPRAFTLIELLIVVAIIAILASIAVPNFLEAQIRAKVARVQSDERTINTAVMCYAIDYQNLPRDGDDADWSSGEFITYDQKAWFAVLTTPIAYLAGVPNDPFNMMDWPPMSFTGQLFPEHGPKTYAYLTFGCFGAPNPNPYGQPENQGIPTNFSIVSVGPNGAFDSATIPNPVDRIYDPSNGTLSGGDVIRSGP
jgi:prepilin-type N-terminal cleavage/methylation domain-containing protein